MPVRFSMKMAGIVSRTVLRAQRRLCASSFGVPTLIKNDEKWSFRWTQQARRAHSSSGSSVAIEKNLLAHLKEQYLEASRMRPPPKIGPPKPFIVIKGALDTDAPVLSRTFNNEEIKISVLRLSVFGPNGEVDDSDEENFNQLFLSVAILKGDEGPALQFICDLYPDAMGIQSVAIKDRKDISKQTLIIPQGYEGPSFQDLDKKLQQAFRQYLEERGINESLFRFLQAWLYVKEHRNLMQWFKTVGTFITKQTVPDNS